MNRKRREKEIFTAKQLLLNRICENCQNRSGNYFCYYKPGRSKIIPVKQNETCEEWREYDGRHRPNIAWE